MDFNEFATKIKAKYPQYADRDNRLLAEAMVKKYPEYADRVTFTPATQEPQQGKLNPSLVAQIGMAGLQQLGGDVVNDIKGNISGLAGTIKAGGLDIPLATAKVPTQLAGGMSPSETDLGQFTQSAAQGMKEGLSELVHNPLKTIATHPVSTALTVGSIAIPGTQIRPITTALKQAVSSRLPKIFKVLGKVPESATETLLQEGGNLPKYNPKLMSQASDTAQEAFKVLEKKGSVAETSNIVKEGLTKRVQNALDKAVTERGELLNKAKKDLGLPTTVEEKEISIGKHGNPFDINHADVLKTDAGEPFAAKAYDWKDQRQVYYKLYGDKNKILELTKGAHGFGSDLPEFVVKNLKIPIKESPYIRNFTNESDLINAISSFKKNAVNMPENIRIKTSSYLQDQINKYVDWNKRGSELEGILKTQHGELKNLAIPETLKTAKGGMKEALDLLDDLENKLGQDKGKAQSFLQKLFSKDTPENKSYIEKLAKLEVISEQPILSRLKEAFTPKHAPEDITNLVNDLERHLGKEPGKAQDFLERTFRSDKGSSNDFTNKLKILEEKSGIKFIHELKKAFASKEFSKITSRPGLEVTEAIHGAMWGLAGHPGVALTTLSALAAQSPAMLKALTKLGIVASKASVPLSPAMFLAAHSPKGFSIMGQHDNGPKLQSLRDKLLNKKKK